ncbi:MAG: MotA/TolQ/ExbB proton channel family protein [Planctomycetales bacterium]|nr:MotA/TolQ/ExbB proton channel family protein [Planctomycetales bacterium]
MKLTRCFLASMIFATAAPLFSQQPNADALASEALQPAPIVQAAEADTAAPLLELMFKGGWLMAPIVLMSVIVLAVTFERILGLRRGRVRPYKLVAALKRQAEAPDFEPQRVYNLCRRYRSALGRVVIATLAKGGRPHAEVEAECQDAVQNEADRMYANVRTLNLAAAVTPLMGLLGTVWGMIQSFFATSQLAEGADKAAVLAEGIYIALMTTFAGLAVAIPAAVLAHFFEGRILRSLRQVESLMNLLMPSIEGLEGGSRVDLRRLERGYQDERNGRPPATSQRPPSGPPPSHLARGASRTSV